MQPVTKQFESGGRTWEIEVRARGFELGERSVKGRAYVWTAGDDLSDANLHIVAKAVGAPHIHTQRDEFPVLDKAWDAHNKIVVALKEQVLSDALKAVTYAPEELKYRFSRYAGCSCPCSPGFIFENLPRVDIFIDLASNRAKLAKKKEAA